MATSTFHKSDNAEKYRTNANFVSPLVVTNGEKGTLAC